MKLPTLMSISDAARMANLTTGMLQYYLRMGRVEFPHGLLTFQPRPRVRYRDDVTGLMPAEISLSGPSTWSPRFHLNRQLRRQLSELRGEAL